MVNVGNAANLGRRHVYNGLDIDGQVATSIEMMLAYVKLRHHGFEAEATGLLKNEVCQKHPEMIVSSVLTRYIPPDKENIKFEVKQLKILEALLVHQLQRKDNPFRLDLEGRNRRSS